MTIFPLHLIPANTNFNFMRLRWPAVILAVLLFVASVGLIAIKGFNFGLDFTSGTVAEVRFEQPADVDLVRENLKSSGYGQAVVQSIGADNGLMIRIDEQKPRPNESVGDVNLRVSADIESAVSIPGNRAVVAKLDVVGSQVSETLKDDASMAAAFVVIGFLIYISFRFEWKFAVVACATTVFDVLMVAGFFSLTGREFDLNVMAGLLAVMGFSINDTIVVFDRVRENFRSLRAEPMEVMNRSINQTLSRTIITSVVFFLSVLALYLYGGESLENLALSQMLGAVIGTLSSIFIACPLLTMGMLAVTKADLLPKARDLEELERRP